MRVNEKQWQRMIERVVWSHQLAFGVTIGQNGIEGSGYGYRKYRQFPGSHRKDSHQRQKGWAKTVKLAHSGGRRKQNVSLERQTSSANMPTWFTCITTCCQARGWLLGALGGMLARSNCSVTLRRSSSRARVSCSKRASCSFTEARMLAAERTS